MPSNVDALWAHAQKLPETCEESCRAKISRAYYALFHEAKLFHQALPSKGHLPADGGGVHKKLYFALCNPTVTDDALQAKSRLAGTHLGLARELRDSADYEMGSAVTKNDVMKCMGFVRRGLANLRSTTTKSSAA
ncbi:conserved protein of unknown function [Cupriavidus taiwanensis]|uniref:HEPN domain-containing protein n=1 Tax=Cupriavidus taiwanensis TaxID=164546 RepID=A0A9Q7UVS0_9BURK|nr:hypothetical protein [Cupriavidus taiwanensis]SPD65474.1 conserved protein of unknown function [Cupriavidus taiwanensis]